MICSKQCLYLVLGKYHYGLHIVTELVLGVGVGWQRGMGWVCGLWGSDIDFNVTWPISTFGGWRERRENGTCSSRNWSEIISRPQTSLRSPIIFLKFLTLIQNDTEEKIIMVIFSVHLCLLISVSIPILPFSIIIPMLRIRLPLKVTFSSGTKRRSLRTWKIYSFIYRRTFYRKNFNIHLY